MQNNPFPTEKRRLGVCKAPGEKCWVNFPMEDNNPVKEEANRKCMCTTKPKRRLLDEIRNLRGGGNKNKEVCGRLMITGPQEVSIKSLAAT